MAFVFEKQNIEDLILIKPDIYQDNRGSFLEFYKKSEFKKNNIKEEFIQDNFSYSKKHVLRGLHFQIPPYSQAKLITCLAGEIIDFTVDLRKNSKTYKQIFKTVLSEKNHRFLYIPKGFGHGFLALDNSLVLYKTSSEYNIKSQYGIFWGDKDLGLNLELDFKPILSKKDEMLPNLKDIEDLL